MESKATIEFSEKDFESISDSTQLARLKGGCIDPHPFPTDVKDILKEVLRPINLGCPIH